MAPKAQPLRSALNKRSPAAPVIPNGTGATAPGTRPSRRGHRHIGGYISPQAHRALKMLCAEQGWTVQELLTESLNDLLAKYHKPEIV